MSTNTGRRIDPSGKSALFQAPVSAPPDHLAPGREKRGKDGLYSTGPRAPGTVIVECHACRVRSRVSFTDLGLRLVPSFWWPKKHYAHRLRCPSCGGFTWCRIGWNE